MAFIVIIVKGYFVGYPEGVKGYKIWCIDGQPSRIVISRDVVFNEEHMLQTMVETEIIATVLNSKQDANLEVEPVDNQKTEEGSSGHPHISDKSSDLDDYQLARDRERRTIKVPKRFDIADLISYAMVVAGNVTGEEADNFKQAIMSRDKLKWIATMKEEIASLKKNNTWILVNKPTNKPLVGCKWIFKLKEGISDSELARYKARLVAKGFTQREGIDFNEVFSLVVKHTSIRVLLSVVAYYDLELDQMDIKTAFLHGNLNEEIPMA